MVAAMSQGKRQERFRLVVAVKAFAKWLVDDNKLAQIPLRKVNDQMPPPIVGDGVVCASGMAYLRGGLANGQQEDATTPAGRPTLLRSDWLPISGAAVTDQGRPLPRYRQALCRCRPENTKNRNWPSGTFRPILQKTYAVSSQRGSHSQRLQSAGGRLMAAMLRTI